MDKIIFELKNYVYLTIILARKFFQEINLPTLILIPVLLYIILLRKWLLKKTLSFILTISLLFILFLHLKNFFVMNFTAEGSGIPLGILQTVTLIVFFMVLLYYATVKE